MKEFKKIQAGVIYLEETETTALVLRNIPKILNDYVSQSEWTTFCDRIDHVLSPIVKFKRQRRLLNILLTVNFCLLLLDFLITQIFFHNSHDTNGSDSGAGGLLLFFQAFGSNGNNNVGDVIMLSHFIFACSLFAIFSIYIISRRFTIIKATEKQIRFVCGGFVLDKPSLNYSLQHHTNNNDDDNNNDANRKYNITANGCYCCCTYHDVLLPVSIEMAISSDDETLVLPVDKLDSFHDEENPRTDSPPGFVSVVKLNNSSNRSYSSTELLEDVELNGGKSPRVGEIPATSHKKTRKSGRKAKISGKSSSSSSSSRRKSGSHDLKVNANTDMSRMEIVDSDHSSSRDFKEKSSSGGRSKNKTYKKVDESKSGSHNKQKSEDGNTAVPNMEINDKNTSEASGGKKKKKSRIDTNRAKEQQQATASSRRNERKKLSKPSKKEQAPSTKKSRSSSHRLPSIASSTSHIIRNIPNNEGQETSPTTTKKDRRIGASYLARKQQASVYSNFVV